MSEESAPARPPRRCRQCGAALEENAAHCWLCAGIQAAPDAAVEAQAASSERDLNPWLTHGAVWLAIVVAALVGFGVLNANDATLAWLYAFTIGPALLFTIAGATLARATGTPWHPVKKTLIFIAAVSVSTILTILIAILLLLAAIVAFLQWCFGGMPPEGVKIGPAPYGAVVRPDAAAGMNEL